MLELGLSLAKLWFIVVSENYLVEVTPMICNYNLTHCAMTIFKTTFQLPGHISSVIYSSKYYWCGTASLFILFLCKLHSVGYERKQVLSQHQNNLHTSVVGFDTKSVSTSLPSIHHPHLPPQRLSR